MARLLLRDLTPGAVYDVQLRAVGDDSVSDWSRKFTLAVDSDSDAPDAPAWASVNDWVVNGDTFVGNWVAINPALPQNQDFFIYEIEVSDGTTDRIIRTNNTTFTLTFENNVAFFGTASATVTARVRSVDNTGNVSAWTTTKNATNPAPDPVASVTVDALLNAIHAAWPASTASDFMDYQVQISTVSSSSGFTTVYTGTENTFTYPTATATDHWIRVLVRDKFGSVSTPTTSVAVQPDSPFVVDTSAPDVPTIDTSSITNNANGIGAVLSLEWSISAPTDLAGFYIAVKKTTDSVWDVRAYNKDDRDAQININSAYTNYHVKIKSFDWKNNESAWSSNTTVTAPAAGTPGKINNVVATAAPGGLRYVWDAAPEANVNNYFVQVATNAGFSTGLITFNTGLSAELTVNGLSPSTTYYMRVRAVNSAGTNGTYSDTNTTATLSYNGSITAISADVITTGTLNNGTIQIGAAADLVLNGGALRSNTYNGAGNDFDASATAGFYLGNDGLRIAQGSVSATAFDSGTINAATINISGTGSIQTTGYSGATGFRLSATSGLEIPDGSLTAKKIVLKTGNNLLSPAHADFEFYSTYYNANLFDTASATFEIRTTSPAPYNNSQYLRHTRVGTTSVSDIYLGTTATDYNIKVQVNVDYTVSAYMRGHPTDDIDVSFGVRWSTGAFSAIAVTVPAGSGWARYSGSVVCPSGVTHALGWFRLNETVDALYYDLDAIQMEETTGGSPSVWSPPGQTLMDGNQIRTGEIRSSNNLTINGVTLPYWIIDTQGTAQFGNLLVRGASVVGSADAEDDDSFIQSYNYSAGQQGWIIRSDGYAEFRQLAADSIDGGVIRVGTLRADIIGPGALNESIKLEGGLEAKGLAGETVGISGEDGFYVIGSPEAAVTSYAVNGTNGNVTINTTTAHGVSVGDYVRFSDIEGTQIVNGTYYLVTSVTDSDTFIFNIPGGTAVTTTNITGTVYGGASENKNTPTYVSFPTDGSKPNIMSGTLEASTLIVNKESAIQGTQYLEPGAVMHIASGITDPKVAPTLNATLDKKTWNFGTMTNPIGLVVGHDDNFYAIGKTSDVVVGYDTYIVRKFSRNVSNGGTTVFTGQLAGKIDGDVHGIAFTPGSTPYYWILTSANATGGTTRTFYLTRYTTAWVAGPTTTVATVANQSTDFKGATLGVDHSASNTVLVMLMRPVTYTGPRVMPFVTTTGTPVAGTELSLSPALSAKTDPVFVTKGTFDYASTRFVVKFKSDKNYYTTGSGGGETPNDHWPTYSATTNAGTWDTVDSRFLEVNDTTGCIVFNSGSSMWAGTETTKKWWVGYSWYENSSGNQTLVGPIAGIELKKRRFLQVTTPDIPRSVSGTPDRARVWLRQISSKPSSPYTGTSWDVRGTISYPQKTTYVDFINTPPADVPATSNTFTADGVEAEIRTTSGNSFWKGDDSAQFYQLTLKGSQNANATAGNTPPLIVGVYSSDHIRIGDNGIYSLSGSTPTRKDFELYASNIEIDVTNGRGWFEGGTNIGLRLRSATGGADTALVLKNNRVVAGISTYNAATTSASNTVDFEALQVISYAGLFDDTLIGGGTTGASINTNGRVIRTSTIKMKEAIQDMTKEEAYSVLGLKSYTFEYKHDNVNPSVPKDPRRYPGFIAEQGAEVGAELWVGRQHKVIRDKNGGIVDVQRDVNGEIIAFRTPDITVAHNVIIKDHETKINELEARIKVLEKNKK